MKWSVGLDVTVRVYTQVEADDRDSAQTEARKVVNGANMGIESMTEHILEILNDQLDNVGYSLEYNSVNLTDDIVPVD